MPKHLPHNYCTICIKPPHNVQKFTAPGQIIYLFGRMRYCIICQKIPHLNVASGETG